VKNLKHRFALSLVGLSALSSCAFAGGHITVPSPDYTDFYSIVGMVIGVATVIMIARKAKTFIR